jgi:PRTRC genetic system protein B
MTNITEQFNQQYVPFKALLLYSYEKPQDYNNGQNKAETQIYVESYDIGRNGKPINAHPLTLKEMTALSQILQTAQEKQDSYLKSRGLLPANVLYVNQQVNGYAVWHTPPQEVSLFFVENLNIASGKYAVPAMVWKANAEHLQVYALKGKVKPQLTSKLYHAPFLNLYQSGQVCMGTVNVDINQSTCLEDFTSKWQQYFFNSYFSHSISGNSNTRTNTTELWRSLAGNNKAFPQDELLSTGYTLKQLLP